MKVLICLLFSTFSFSQTHSFAEAHKNVEMSSFIFLENCSAVKEYLDKGIETKSLFLFLQSGIEPARNKGDSAFESKYDIHYYDEGCVGSMCSVEYNFLAFDYLQNKYGQEWIKKIRKDTLGLDEWKQNRKVKK